METRGGFYITQIKQLQDRIFERLLLKNGIEISGGQGRILYILWKTDHLTVSEISAKTSLAKNTISAVIDGMVNKGIVERAMNPGNRRQTIISLTEYAKSLQAKYEAVSQQMNALFYQDFSEKNGCSLKAILRGSWKPSPNICARTADPMQQENHLSETLCLKTGRARGIRKPSTLHWPNRKENDSMKRAHIIKFIQSQKTAFVASVDEDGFPNIKAMYAPRKIEGNSFYFSTNTSSMRSQQFLKNPKASIYFYSRGRFKYEGIMLTGTMEVLQDARIKEKIWQAGDTFYYKQGVTDPDYCVLKFTAAKGRHYCSLKSESFDMEELK